MPKYERPVVEPLGSVHELTKTFVSVKRGHGFDRRGKRKCIYGGS